MNELQATIDSLNPQQREAALNIYGPELIVAGAGSGKTKVLTTRTAVLLDMGVIPERILALTFTKKAANEMKARIFNLAGPSAKRLRMGTFHSILASLIRPFANNIGFMDNYTILDEDDSEKCLKQCIRNVLESTRKPEKARTESDLKRYKAQDEHYKVKDIKKRISFCKNRLITHEVYNLSENAAQVRDPRFSESDYQTSVELKKQDANCERELTGQIYTEYANVCRTSNMMDFDDILMHTHTLMHENEEIRNILAAHFDFIMVDEYQDTNIAQLRILQQLTYRNRNICVVGDDSQSIYAFRGAQVENILSFPQMFAGTKVFRLEKNYRSTRTIVESANTLISHNTKRIEKKCYSESETGDNIHVQLCENEKDEAGFIIDTIREKMSNEGMSPKDFAVLYRTNAQSRALEQSMIKKSMKYNIYSGMSFFDRMEVKDQLAYFKLAVNPHDEMSLRRVINKPARGVGETTVNRIAEYARFRRCSMWDLITSRELFMLKLPQKAMDGIREFRDLICDAYQEARTKTAAEAAYNLTNTSGLISEYMQKNDPESQERINNIKELMSSVMAYEDEINELNEGKGEQEKIPKTLDGFVQNVMLLTEAEKNDKNSDTISMMTIHGSKGLEFKCVFVTGMEENLFPSVREEYSSEKELEEERRLFYVAMTRAEKYLYLTHTRERTLYGAKKQNRISRFIGEMRNEK